MSVWTLVCEVCGQEFTIPPDKIPPDHLPTDRITLGFAIPQHSKPDAPDEMCPGSASVVPPHYRQEGE